MLDEYQMAEFASNYEMDMIVILLNSSLCPRWDQFDSSMYFFQVLAICRLYGWASMILLKKGALCGLMAPNQVTEIGARESQITVAVMKTAL